MTFLKYHMAFLLVLVVAGKHGGIQANREADDVQMLQNTKQRKESEASAASLEADDGEANDEDCLTGRCKRPTARPHKASCPDGAEAAEACHTVPFLRSLHDGFVSAGTCDSNAVVCKTLEQAAAAFQNGENLLLGQGLAEFMLSSDGGDSSDRPFGADQRYLVDLAKLIKGYSATFYGESETCCSDGDTSCCNHTRANFPGPEAQSVLSNAEIAAKMAEVPSLQTSGAITRRNMLGYLTLNDMFWYDKPEGARMLGLGGPVDEHKFVRPFLDRVFGEKGGWVTKDIEQSAIDFVSAKSEIKFQDDVKAWTQQVLHRLIYGVDITEEEAQEFVEFESNVLKLVVLPQFAVDLARSASFGETLLHRASGFNGVKEAKDKYLQKWLPIIKTRYCQDCDAEQAAGINSNLLDACIFAGGLSVPGVIAPGLAVLYAGERSPAPGLTLTQSNVRQFAWEAARYFPPVLGFPYVNQSETRPLQIMAVGMGQRAADAWGDDAETPAFRLRNMSTYDEKWVGHADHAVDPAGEMTRVCPGKTLSMTMIEAWYKAWDQAAWAPAKGTKFSFDDRLTFINDFTMVRI